MYSYEIENAWTDTKISNKNCKFHKYFNWFKLYFIETYLKKKNYSSLVQIMIKILVNPPS